MRRKSTFLARVNQMPHPRYLNLGSGPRGLTDSHWCNVDGFNDINVQYAMDFNKRFAFASETFDGIFCEHVFEHFTLQDGQMLLRECLRVLRPGGCIRLIMPDAEKVIRTYLEQPEELLRVRPVESGCAMEAVNSWCYQRYEHQCLYDANLLRFQLQQAGFDRIERCAFQQGDSSKPILLDDQKYEWESLYMEAIKPSSVGQFISK